MSLKKKKFINNEITLEVPMPDFIPYTCHYSPTTLLTKNGELLQFIKITGFAFETVGAVKVGLRETVRKAITTSINSNKISLWLHTVRRTANLDPGGTYDTNFASFLNQAWNEKHNLSNQYMNELYITITHQSKSVSLKKVLETLTSLSTKKLNKAHMDYLDDAEKLLSNTSQKLLKILQNFGARQLGIRQKGNISYSEPLEFLGKIINLAEMEIPAPISDISEYLGTHKVAFGNNALEVIGKTGKHFASILTIKEYHELTDKAIDQVLQLNQPFVITQSVNFVHKDIAQEPFKQPAYILEISGDTRLSESSGINEVMQSDNNTPTDYGHQQLTIMPVASNLENLKENTLKIISELSRFGMLAVQEDLRMEQCFWSQLPANFNYLCRQNYINTRKLAGFASLHNFPAGKRNENKWGPAVTVFHTKAGTPYFFNFHYEDNGHTMIIGPFGAGKTVLMNFLVSEAQKFKNKLFFLDQERASKVFIKAIGGNYSIISAKHPTESPFNPLALENTPENKTFLQKWFPLILSINNYTLSNQEQTIINKLCSTLLNSPVEKRSFKAIKKYFEKYNALKLAEQINHWSGEGKYNGLFDNTTSVFSEEQHIYGFGMSQVLDKPEIIGPVLSFIFHKIELSLDGSPAIIVLDEAWKLIDNNIFAPELGNWLERMQKNNVMVIFATESVEDASESKITSEIMKHVATQIYLPNPKATNAYQEIFGLNKKEFKLLTAMKVKNRQFLFKHGDDTIVAELNLTGMKELSVLSGGDETVEIMEKIIQQYGEKPDEWLPAFYQETSVL